MNEPFPSRTPAQPSVLSVGATEARERFSDLLSRVAYRGERVVFTRNGQDVGVLVPMEDYERLLHLDGSSTDGPSADGSSRDGSAERSPSPLPPTAHE